VTNNYAYDKCLMCGKSTTLDPDLNRKFQIDLCEVFDGIFYCEECCDKHNFKFSADNKIDLDSLDTQFY
jgi:hypothetical protein